MIAVAASIGPSVYWYLARSTGAVALLLLTATVVLGILGPLRVAATPRWPRFSIDLMHRDISLLVMVLLVLHIATSVLDGFAPVGWLDGLIPFVSGYRPLWLGLGTLSFDLLIALVITSLLRVRIGYRWWRGIHWLAYASWPVAVLHGLGTGSDTKTWWMLALTFVCVAVVAMAVLVRIARSRPVPESLRSLTTGAAVLTPLGIVIFTLAGPLAAGWARRAGTPARLLSHPATLVAARKPVSSPTRPSLLTHPFTASLTGTISRRLVSQVAVLELDLRLHGQVQGRMRVRMGGTPLGGGGLSLTGSQVDLTAVGLSTALDGRIVSLQGSHFLARVSNGSGSVVDVRADLQVDSQANTVTGSVSGAPGGTG